MDWPHTPTPHIPLDLESAGDAAQAPTCVPKDVDSAAPAPLFGAAEAPICVPKDEDSAAPAPLVDAAAGLTALLKTTDRSSPICVLVVASCEVASHLRCAAHAV